jgi:hypothetical protein
MADGKINGNRGCDDSKPDCDHGKKGEPERNAIVEHPMTIKVDDSAFFLSGFHTCRTKMFAAQFHVAQGA